MPPSSLSSPATPRVDSATETIEDVLASARKILGMDIAYLAEFDAGLQVSRFVEGDGSTF